MKRGKWGYQPRKNAKRGKRMNGSMSFLPIPLAILVNVGVNLSRLNVAKRKAVSFIVDENVVIKLIQCFALWQQT